MYQSPSNGENSECILFVGNLPQDYTEELLLQNVQIFGSIRSIDFQANSKSSPFEQQSFYANITFQTRASAEAAYQFINGKSINGRKLTVGLKDIRRQQKNHFFPPQSPTPLTDFSRQSQFSRDFVETVQSTPNNYFPHGASSMKKSQSAQIHFSYISSRLEPVTPEAVGSTFSKFGSEIEVSLKKADHNWLTGVQTGYGFIHYPLTIPGICAALRAVKQVSGSVVDAIKFSCSVSHSLDEYFKAMDPAQVNHIQLLISSEQQTYRFPPEISQIQTAGYQTFLPLQTRDDSLSFPPPPSTSTTNSNANTAHQYSTSSYNLF